MSRSKDGYTYQDGYAYQRTGTSIVNWKGGVPPHQSRAGDTTGMGSLGGASLVLPKAGAPEPINGGYISDKAMSGCGCGTGGMHGIGDTISGLSTPVKIAGVVGLYLLYKKLKKK